MPKATIIAQVDFPEEVEAVDAWLDKWEAHLDYLSENLGCGCCINMFNVEASRDALDELPEHLLGSSEWAE